MNEKTCQGIIFVLSMATHSIGFSDGLPTQTVDGLPSQAVEKLPTQSIDELPTNTVDELPTQTIDHVSSQKSKNEFKLKNLSLQLGWINFSQSYTQHVNISGIIGDDFSSTTPNSNTGLVGLGYYPLAQTFDYFTLSGGVNAFYLGHTIVQGTVTQENLYTNLAYSYGLTNWPIYFGVKIDAKYPRDKDYNVTVDLGIGPDVVVTNNFYETPLVDYTLPDYIFTGKTSVSFAAMAGIGLKFNHVLGDHPLECGYRFMYLGPAALNPVSTQVLNPLNTGNNYANALMCGMSL